MQLVIGNKAYSSWSLRPWLLMRQFGIAFDEIVIPLYRPESKAAILAHSASGKVPCLVAGDVHVWDSLAIIEYVAELRPDLAIWPRESAARALARSLACEMHSGFGELRAHLSCNFRRTPKKRELSAGAAADVARLQTAFADARARFGAAGPFLFGEFSAADAMFAPVASRLNVYEVDVDATTRGWMQAVMALPAWREWIEAGRREPWTIEPFEL